MTDEQKAELKLAKLRLYHLLLNKNNEDLTATEVELGYRLALDEQVQQHLDEHMGRYVPPCENAGGVYCPYRKDGRVACYDKGLGGGIDVQKCPGQ